MDSWLFFHLPHSKTTWIIYQWRKKDIKKNQEFWGTSDLLQQLYLNLWKQQSLSQSSSSEIYVYVDNPLPYAADRMKAFKLQAATCIFDS